MDICTLHFIGGVLVGFWLRFLSSKLKTRDHEAHFVRVHYAHRIVECSHKGHDLTDFGNICKRCGAFIPANEQ